MKTLLFIAFFFFFLSSALLISSSTALSLKRLKNIGQKLRSYHIMISCLTIHFLPMFTKGMCLCLPYSFLVKVIIFFSLWMKSSDVNNEFKSLWQCFHVILFAFQYFQVWLKRRHLRLTVDTQGRRSNSFLGFLLRLVDLACYFRMKQKSKIRQETFHNA